MPIHWSDRSGMHHDSEIVANSGDSEEPDLCRLSWVPRSPGQIGLIRAYWCGRAPGREALAGPNAHDGCL